MDNLENVSIESEREAEIEKEKVTELDLVFEVMGEKPYYQIKQERNFVLFRFCGVNFYCYYSIGWEGLCQIENV